MSRAALCTAVRDQLRASVIQGGLALSNLECELAPFAGQPPPSCGERFVGIYCGGRTNRTPNYGFDESYTLKIAISMRAPRIPFDRLGPDLVSKASLGLDDLVDAVRLIVGKDYATGLIRARSNAIIGVNEGVTGGKRGFLGLRFVSESDCQPVSGAWFQADPDEPYAGVVIQQTYIDERVQSWIDGGTVT